MNDDPLATCDHMEGVEYNDGSLIPRCMECGKPVEWAFDYALQRDLDRWRDAS